MSEFDETVDGILGDKPAGEGFPKGHRARPSYQVMHNSSRQIATIVYNDDDSLWHIDFRDQDITMPNLENIEKYGFSISGGGGGGSMGGERLSIKNLKVVDMR